MSSVNIRPTVHDLIDEVYWRQEARQNAQDFPEDVALVQAKARELGIVLTPEEAAAIYAWYSQEFYCAGWLMMTEREAEQALAWFFRAAGHPIDNRRDE